MAGFDLKDYVDVAERIQMFRKKHPEGSLQSEVLRWPDEGFPFVVVRAEAFRTPDDQRPGVGLAWENYPGRTPYTKDSELMNAETAAWGRAIVAVLAGETKRSVASRDEVFRAQANRTSEGAGAPGSDTSVASSETSVGEVKGLNDSTEKAEPEGQPERTFASPSGSSDWPAVLASPAQRKAIIRERDKLGWDEEFLTAFAKKPVEELTHDEAKALLMEMAAEKASA